MTCRWLLWITAAGVSVGAVVSAPSIAAAEPDEGWFVTIDEPATEVVDSKHLRIGGTVSDQGVVAAVLDGVTVTVVPQGLPEQCGPESGPAVVEGDRYAIELEVGCNGPHQIQVLAQGPSGSSAAEPRSIGVAEAPPTPAAPGLDVTDEGGLWATWEPTDDLDAAGSVLVVNRREDLYAVGVVEAVLPPSDRRASVAVRALRWGAGGPGTTVSSSESMGNLVGELIPNQPTPNIPNKPHEPGPRPEEPGLPPSEPAPEPPAATPPSPTPVGPSRPDLPRPTSSTTPTPSAEVPPTTLPHSDDLLSDVPDDAVVIPRTEPHRRPSSDTEEQAVSPAAPVGGLVRTTDERSPGLVAPLALALLMITIAVHLAWHLRRPRARPTT